MRTASATKQQGRHLMARTTPAGESWSVWLRLYMAAKGWEKQAQLVAGLEAAGVLITRQVASKWLNGENAADPNTAVLVADVFGASRASALRAIGLDVVADGMEKESAREATGGTDPVYDDIQIQRLMAREDKSLARRLEMVRRYRRRIALIVDHMLEDADADEGEGREPGNRANTG